MTTTQPKHLAPGIYRITGGQFTGQLFDVEGPDVEMWGTWWGLVKGNPTCLLFAKRLVDDKLPFTQLGYYGKFLRNPDDECGTGFGIMLHPIEIGDRVRDSSLTPRKVTA